MTPVAVLGHSAGEIAAAWCAGALSLEQVIDVVIARSRHQESVRVAARWQRYCWGTRSAAFSQQRMCLGVDLSHQRWRSVTVSGPVDGTTEC